MRARSPLRQRGLSLVELMIGSVLGLLAMVVIMQVWSGSQANRRAMTGASDAGQAGTLAAWRLGRELRMAGAGLQAGAFTWGCELDVQRAGATLLPAPAAWPAPFDVMPTAMRLWPVIVRDGGAGPDVLVTMGARSAAANLALPMTPAGTTAVTTSSVVAFAAGDLLLAASARQNDRCLVGQVEGGFTPPLDAAASSLPLGGTNAPYNRAGGFSALASGDWLLLGLGRAPSFTMVGVAAAGGLQQLDLLRLGAADPVTMADGVVDMQVLYGVDDGSGGATANDNRVDAWVSPGTAPWDFATLSLPGARDRLLQIKALRVALLLRGADRAARASPATLRAFGDLSGLALDLPIPAAMRAFPHQVHEFTVPLRNQANALCAEVRRAGGLPQGGACG